MNIIGHQRIIKFLDESIEKDTISQAYLFSGSKHLGKFSVALEFAKKLVGGNEQEANPDIIIISPEIEEKKGIKKEKDIKIEKIRELERSLSLSSYFGKYKVAIINDADRLTVSAQNSLLKTLEEPQKKCVIILVCHDQERILSTIKSRCLTKKFSLVNDAEIRKNLIGNQKQEEIIFWSLNRPGIAINLQVNKKDLEKRLESVSELKSLLKCNLSEKLKFCEDLSKNTEELSDKLNWWVLILRKNILEKKLLNLDLKKSLEMIEEIQASLRIFRETNSNAKVILENLVLKF